MFFKIAIFKIEVVLSSDKAENKDFIVKKIPVKGSED